MKVSLQFMLNKIQQLYNLPRRDSRLEAAAWSEADDSHAACPLRADLQESRQNGMVSMQAKRADVRLVHPRGDLRFHFTLFVIVSIDQSLQHEGGRFIM